MNLIQKYYQGQRGENKGLYMGDGLIHLNRALNGIQRGRIYAIASPAKIGKTTIVDNAFVINPFLYSIQNNINIEWLYFSYEIDRISKEFDYAAHFLNHDYGIEYIKLENQVYIQNKIPTNRIPLSADYLKGILFDDKGEIIRVKPRVEEALKRVYRNRIVPIFGEYNTKGEKIKEGKIKFFTNRENPTGIFNYLKQYARENGTFTHTTFNDKEKPVSYTPNDPQKYVIVIVDHMRKLFPERNYNMKQLVDKMSEYMVELRDMCNFTFVPIIHTNRSITDPERLKIAKDKLYPTSEDLKDTGNISEDCNYLITMFNPNDDRYKLTKHFELTIRDVNDNPIYPNLRTIHLAESRHCLFPQHFKTNMYGNIKKFEEIL